MGNLRSVAKAFERLGHAPVVSSDPEEVAGADRVVLPGQGAFGDCMARLQADGLDEAVRGHLATGDPFLGICVGLQLLFEESEEAENEEEIERKRWDQVFQEEAAKLINAKEKKIALV